MSMAERYLSESSVLQAVGDINPLDYNGQGIVERIKAIPAADVVEVVRCYECKHYRSWGKVYERKDYTGLCTEWSNMSVHKTEFCSRAIRKRKDGGQDDV